MERKSNILLVLDLDETLIHASETKLSLPEDFVYEEYFVYKRRGLADFLLKVSDHFALGIWSSAGDEYVAEIVKHLKPVNSDFEFVWGRSKCTARRDFDLDSYYWEKRLSKLKRKGFALEKILIVDDSPEKARNNFGNAIYISPFVGDQQDNELELLHRYLVGIKSVDNVRKIEKRNWRNAGI